MERFTDAKGRKKSMVSSVAAYKKLAEYEDIGLTPEQVRALADAADKKGESHGEDSN